MTSEERAEKWSKGIPEMEDLSIEDKKLVCHQAAVQMIVIIAVIELILVIFYEWLEFHSPAVFDYSNHADDVLNYNFAHTSQTRNGHIAAIILDLPVMLPIIIPTLIPIFVIAFGCRKYFVRRALRKLSRQWRLETNLTSTQRFTFDDVKAWMDLLQDGRIQFLSVTPPAGLMDSLFMQTYHDGENLYALEVRIEGKNHAVLYEKDGLTKEEVLYALDNYINQKRVPDVSGWEKIATFEKKVEIKEQIKVRTKDALLRLFLKDHSRKAYEKIRTAAGRGDGKALYMLSCYCSDGYGVRQIDEKYEGECFKKSWAAGYPVAGFDVAETLPADSPERARILEHVKDAVAALAKEEDYFAQNTMGLMFHKGMGVTRDVVEAAKWYGRAAQQGYARAQYDLGGMYDYGVGVEQSYEKAVAWYRKAAEQGLASAQNNLGIKYDRGQGVKQSDEKAAEWYRKAAEQGYPYAQNNLGLMYEDGSGVEQSDEKAAEWYRKAAEQGLALAQKRLGVLYEDGRGVERSCEQALEWYRKAAEQGFDIAQYNLGLMYENGRGTEQSYEKAVEWYRKAAEQGLAPAQRNLGYMYDLGRGVKQSYEQAVEWYQKAADQGYAGGQFNLGCMYDRGHGVEQSYEKAVEWYRKAAEQGFAPAQSNLAFMYKKGRGVEQSDEKAAEWYRKSAEQGFNMAQFGLGCLYYNGEGVEKSYAKAAEWFQKAADQGYAPAQTYLGEMYRDGKGVERSLEKAEELFRRAADQGSGLADGH